MICDRCKKRIEAGICLKRACYNVYPDHYALEFPWDEKELLFCIECWDNFIYNNLEAFWGTLGKKDEANK